jgi:hypothetical protein
LNEVSAVGAVELPKRPFCMQLTSRGRTLVVHFEDKSELHAWLAAIEARRKQVRVDSIYSFLFSFDL